MNNSDKVTLVYLNWRRGKQLSTIIEAASKQTLPVHIVVVDNAYDDVDNKVETSLAEIVPADNSVQCWARWKYITENVNTPYVCVMDDDLIFTSDTVLEEFYNVLDQNPQVDAAGTFGVVLQKGKGYAGSIHIHGNQYQQPVKVDIIKGRFIFIRTESLKGLDSTPDYTCDDIKVTSHLPFKITLPVSNAGFRDLDDNDAVSLRPDHAQKRQVAVEKYFADLA